MPEKAARESWILDTLCIWSYNTVFNYVVMLLFSQGVLHQIDDTHRVQQLFNILFSLPCSTCGSRPYFLLFKLCPEDRLIIFLASFSVVLIAAVAEFFTNINEFISTFQLNEGEQLHFTNGKWSYREIKVKSIHLFQMPNLRCIRSDFFRIFNIESTKHNSHRLHLQC